MLGKDGRTHCRLETTAHPLVKSPTLRIVVVGVGNLNELDAGTVEPYVVFAYGQESARTQVVVWEEERDEIEFDVEEEIPLRVKVMDRDSLGSDTLISSMLIPYSYFSRWRGYPHNVYFRIEEGSFDESEDGYMRDITINEKSILETLENSEEPPAAYAYLHLRLYYISPLCLSRLQISVPTHHILSARTETFTVYTVEILRGDGHKWNLLVRYSQVWALKNYLAGLFAEFHYVEFPGKTMWECLAGVCPCLSRFDASRIEERKAGIARFLSLAVSKSPDLAIAVLDLLQSLPLRRSA